MERKVPWAVQTVLGHCTYYTGFWLTNNSPSRGRIWAKPVASRTVFLRQARGARAEKELEI